MFTVEVIR